MSLQVIKSVDGKDEYVLLPITIYRVMHDQINARLTKLKKSSDDYVPFDPADYVENPIALARIKAGITQAALAKRMKVSQAYISKIESQKNVTAKLLQKVKKVLTHL
jgi:ribosome-binding protein aMBF1 (putative translation factor)